MSEIVVGLDLSPSAGAALKWAAEQARARGQILRAVHAVDVSPDFNMALGMGGVAVPMDPSAMDIPYRAEVAALFDSVQPQLGWRLHFFSGEAGPSWWLNRSERRCSLSAPRTCGHRSACLWFREPLLPQPHTVPGGRGSSRKRPWRR